VGVAEGALRRSCRGSGEWPNESLLIMIIDDMDYVTLYIARRERAWRERGDEVRVRKVEQRCERVCYNISFM
jgi:hypothetical protein